MIEIDRNRLLKACEVLGPVVSQERRRKTVLVLGHYLLRVQQGRLLLSVADLDMVATMVVGRVSGDLFDSQSFAMTADSAVFEAAVRSAPLNSMVQLEAQDEGKVLITAPGVMATAASCPASDFPDIPDVHDAPTSVKIDRRDLLGALARTIPAISRDETRYHLNGICITSRDGLVHLVATDGMRLSLAGLPVHAPDALEPTIVPNDAVRMLRHMLGQVVVDDVHLGVSGLRGTFLFGDVTLTFRAIDGKFPDFARVIPDTTADPFVVHTNVEALRSALAGMHFSEDGRPLTLTVGEALVALSDNERDRGHIEVRIKHATCSGGGKEVGIKPAYLRDVLASISGPLEIRMRRGDKEPIVFRASGHPRWLGVVMPMRLS